MPQAPGAQPDQPAPQSDLLSERHILIRPIRVMRRVRRRNRWILRILLAIPLLGITGGIILTRSAVTRWLVIPQLERALNMDVHANAVFVGVNGKLYIDRAHFRLPGIQGRAGDFLRVARVEVDVDWLGSLGSIIRGSADAQLRRIHMTEPVVTISQSLEDDSLNIARLALPASSGSRGLPNIHATSAGIELAEHSPTTYTVLKHIRMDGLLVPAKNDPSGYTFKLTEKPARLRRAGETADPGFKLEGTLGSTGTLAVTMQNFSLDDWPDKSIPTAVRELFTELHLEGQVPGAYLTYSPDKGLAARLDLANVGLDLPIQPTELTTIPEDGVPVQELYGPPPRAMRMHGVTGSITFASDQVNAQIRGLIENLPYQVDLKYLGTGADAPFECTVVSNDFTVDRNPRLLLYAPPVVKYRLSTFSSPTAVVNTRLTITRGAPVNGEPGEINLEGEFEMRDGVAAYDDFPYEFKDLAGLFRFTEDSLEFVNITGRSESGAELTASGRIAPLTDDAQVDVAVDVRNAPIDDAMEAAIGGGRGEMIPALFSQDRYDELRAAGLVQSPEEAEEAARTLGALLARQGAGDPAPELAQQIEGARARAAIPAFAFRGLADVAVRVHRPAGHETDWQTRIEISLPEVGLLPDKFPLPIAATNVVARVNDRDGALVSGDFKGLTGGRADVAATFTIPFSDDENQDVLPDITIQAEGIPLDPLLIHALPGDNPTEQPVPPVDVAAGDGALVPSGSTPTSTIKRILHDLNIAGLGDGRVRISPRVGGELGFDADFALQDCAMLPRDSDISLGNIAGRVRASETDVDLELAAQARARSGDQWRAISGPMNIRIHADVPPAASDAPASYTANLSIPSIDLASKVEPLVHIFSPAAAAQIAELRADYRPAGEVDLTLDIASTGHDNTRVDLDARGSRPVSFDALSGRFSLTPTAGLIRIRSADATTVAFDDFHADVRFNNGFAGKADITGSMLVSAPDTAPDGQAPGVVNVSLRDAPIESPLTANIVVNRLGQSELWSAHQPRGLFDADLHFTSDPGATSRPASGRTGALASDSPLHIRGSITPRALTVNAGGSDLTFTGVHGSIDFGPGIGALRQLSLETPDWSAFASASWTSSQSGFQVQSDLGLHGGRSTDQLFALLPADIADILEGISFRLDGPFQLRDATLNLSRGADPGTRFLGVLETDSAFLEAGVEIQNLAGAAAISYTKQAGADPQFEVAASATEFQGAGLAMTSGYARVINGEAPGEVLIPDAFAHVHGGRIAATAKILPVPSADTTNGRGALMSDAPTAQKSYTAAVSLSGLRFASILKDLESHLPLPDGIDQADDRSRGLLEGNFTLQGAIGNPHTRRGRGSFQIAGGRILNVPFAMRMVELSNLQLPTNARLGYARGSFFLEGDTVTFEDLGLYSAAVQILGSGTMTWPDKALDLRFDTKPARGIPILSWLVRGIRDELVTTTVTGTIADPDISLKQFPGPRRMLDRAVGNGSDEPPVDGPERTADADGRPMHEGIRPTQPVSPARNLD